MGNRKDIIIVYKCIGVCVIIVWICIYVYIYMCIYIYVYINIYIYIRYLRLTVA